MNYDIYGKNIAFLFFFNLILDGLNIFPLQWIDIPEVIYHPFIHF